MYKAAAAKSSGNSIRVQTIFFDEESLSGGTLQLRPQVWHLWTRRTARLRERVHQHVTFVHADYTCARVYCNTLGCTCFARASVAKGHLRRTCTALRAQMKRGEAVEC